MALAVVGNNPELLVVPMRPQHVTLEAQIALVPKKNPIVTNQLPYS